LKRGEKGADVARQKQLLNEVGKYLSPQISAGSGEEYDARMEAAVSGFHDFFHRASDGMLGRGTMDFLHRVKFVCELLVPALSLETTTGIPAMATLLQAAHESNFGRTDLARRANNLFGVKWNGKGPYLEMDTWEEVGGQRQPMRAKFQVYESRQVCFQDRGRLLTNANFSPALKHRGDPLRYLAILLTECKYPYATDSGYLDRCRRLARELRLETIVANARQQLLNQSWPEVFRIRARCFEKRC